VFTTTSPPPAFKLNAPVAVVNVFAPVVIVPAPAVVNVSAPVVNAVIGLAINIDPDVALNVRDSALLRLTAPVVVIADVVVLPVLNVIELGGPPIVSAFPPAITDVADASVIASVPGCIVNPPVVVKVAVAPVVVIALVPLVTSVIPPLAVKLIPAVSVIAPPVV
jgi:hypothetical protein